MRIPDGLSRYSGLLTVGILWSSISIGIYKSHLDIFGKSPLSSLGVMENSAGIFTTGLVLAAVTIFYFTYYLRKNYVVSKGFLAALFIGQIGQIIAALVHYGGDQPDRAIHTFAALTLAFSIPIALWRFAVAQPKGKIRKNAYRLFWFELAAFVVGIGLFSFIAKGAPFAQMMPAIAFHVWIIYFSLVNPGN